MFATNRNKEAVHAGLSVAIVLNLRGRTVSVH